MTITGAVLSDHKQQCIPVNLVGRSIVKAMVFSLGIVELEADPQPAFPYPPYGHIGNNRCHAIWHITGVITIIHDSLCKISVLSPTP
jgi:hypothetical protein